MGEFNTKGGFNFRTLYEQSQQPEKEEFVIPKEEEPVQTSSDNAFQGVSTFNGTTDDQDSSDNSDNKPEFDVSKDLSETHQIQRVPDEFDYVSFLGTPLSMPVKLDSYQLPNEPIVTITGDKKIVRTALTGVSKNSPVQRRGTVKELIGVNDYQIKISGVVVNETKDGANVYPEDEIKALKRLYELRRTISINCKLTEIFNIWQIAIHRISLPGEPGKLNSQRYEIIAYSDEDFATDLLSRS